ncbi:protein kinase domain-containing protein [Micromonospora sp. LOL_015]|uniref:protein kinase domain-containing protein n=1 Tax=Micromonospora sp. LOL_015 TaxID=3345416 RepID=UPI003A87B6F2
MSPLSSTDPERLDNYLLVGRLGVGGMGVVYLAERDDGTYVAVKLIHAALASDLEFIGRFRSEVERARQVPPFCTAEFVDANLDHDPPYLVVEYVDGPSLEEVVLERGPMQGGALHSLAVGVATALAGIHGAGVVHRDLKPDNVLLPPGSPKVIDFGIARPADATSAHTRPDVMVGTVAYMAPERFSGEPGTPVTAAADIFAWGCVIAYAGTGRTPFHGDSPSATAGRILTQPPDLDGIPASLREPLSRALSKEPVDRPTAQELIAMLLDRSLEPEPPAAGERDTAPETSPVPARRPTGRRRVRVGALVAAAAVAMAVAVANYAAEGTDARRQTATTPQTSHAAPPAPASAASGASAAATTGAPYPSAVSSQQPAPPDRTPDARPQGGQAAASEKPPSTGAAVPAAANPTGRNLALGRPVSASSAEGAVQAAANAVDGDLATRWGSAFSDVQWLTVDLGGQWQIHEIVLRWERSYAVSYRVEVSLDGDSWTTVYSTASGQGGDAVIAAGGTPGRFVRMYATRRSGDYGYSLYEVEVR